MLVAEAVRLPVEVKLASPTWLDVVSAEAASVPVEFKELPAC